MKNLPTKCWEKHLIFFKLSYWKNLNLKLFIDLIHKNIFDKLISTLICVWDKTKDNINERMGTMGMRMTNGLGTLEKPGKKSIPLIPHTLSRDEKRVLLQIFHSIKGNIKILIQHQEYCSFA